MFEIRHDDGNRKRQGQHSGQRAQTSDELSEPGGGCDVTIADRCHGDETIPEGVRNAPESGRLLFRVEHGGGESEHAETEEEDEHAQLVEACLQSVAEYLQALRVSRQFEDPEKTDKPDDAERGEGCGFAVVESEHDEVWEDGEKVEYIEKGEKELVFGGRRHQSCTVLDSKPYNTTQFEGKPRLALTVLPVYHFVSRLI